MAGIEAVSRWRVVRVVAGLQFVVTGAFSVLNWRETVAFNEALVGERASAAATGIGAALAIVGGLSLATGCRSNLGATSLLVFLVPATIRHLIVATRVDTRSLNGELAERGQLASASKNLVLVALMVVFVLATDSRSRSPTSE